MTFQKSIVLLDCKLCFRPRYHMDRLFPEDLQILGLIRRVVFLSHCWQSSRFVFCRCAAQTRVRMYPWNSITSTHLRIRLNMNAALCYSTFMAASCTIRKHFLQWHHRPINEPWSLLGCFPLRRFSTNIFYRVRLSSSFPTPPPPQPGGTDRQIYTPQRQACPAIPPGTG
jgi:hypothetical protein